jgi:outer membrane protein OmpA-like peptidoglycan-associated protein
MRSSTRAVGPRGWRSLVTAGALVASTAAVAAADGLDAERFTPAVGSEPGFSFEHPAVPFHLGWSVGLFVDLADDPVVERGADDTILSRPLDLASTMDLVGSIGLFGWAELGVHLPLQMIYSGDDFPLSGSLLSASAGFGDLRLVPKAALFRHGTAASHVLVGLALPMSFPTGDAEALRGAGGFTLGPRLLVALHRDRLGFGANLGYQWRAEHPDGIPWGDELALSLMASYEVTPDRLQVQGEIFGGKQVRTETDGADLTLEGLLGLIVRPTPSLGLHLGAGLGLHDGIGAPDFRLVAGVRFSHGVSTRHGFGDADRDGILDKDDGCPTEAEDADDFRDDDGCPEIDNDLDGVLDASDECPDMPEEAGGDGDGCPSRTFVRFLDGQIEIFGKVQFKLGSAELDRKSGPLLDQIAAAMRANPQAHTIRIEGHTDDLGDAGFNQRLSEDRAANVRRALIDRGVDKGRLETRGLGETQPAAPNASPAGRAKNRRVEFLIVEGKR